MKKLISFLIFILYSTSVFFFPNNELILIFILINLAILLFAKLQIKKVLISTLKVMPFIIFTFIINCILDEYINAIWIGIKLIIVCNITIIYSKTTSVTRSSGNHTIIVFTIKNLQNKYRGNKNNGMHIFIYDTSIKKRFI